MTFGIWDFQVRLTGTRIFTNNVINKACINRCNKLFVFDGQNDTLIVRIYFIENRNIETRSPIHSISIFYGVKSLGNPSWIQAGSCVQEKRRNKRG